MRRRHSQILHTRLINMAWIQISSFLSTLEIDRFFFFNLAVAVIVAANDPKASQRFADDATVSDSLSLGGGGEEEGSCSVCFGWLFT